MIRIDASRRLGSANQIGDLLGMGVRGDPPDHSFIPLATDREHPVNQAWRRLKLKHLPFDDVALYKVKSVSSSAIEVDFAAYDTLVKGITGVLDAEPFVNLVFVPPELSSAPENAFSRNFYMPKDLREWELFTKAIVRHSVEDLGLAGLYYDALGEPGWAGEYAGHYFTAYSYGEHQDKYTRLDNTIRLYATTYRAVRSIDPTARVCAPGNASIGDLSEGNHSLPPEVFDMGDWLKALQAYNTELPPGERVSIDCAGWQEYGWTGERISDAAEQVSRLLAKYGFDPNTPKVTVGGGGCGSWCWNWLNLKITPAQQASHILYNVIREFGDPSKRTFVRTLYYFFNESEEWGQWLGPEDGVSSALVYVKKDGTVEYRTGFAAFQIAGMLADQDDIVQATTEGDLESMAVRSGDERVMAVANNHSEAAQDADIAFEHLPFASDKVTVLIQLINNEHSNDGRGLESGTANHHAMTDNTVRLQLELPAYTTAIITLEPMN